MIVVTVFLLIMNESEFRLAYNEKQKISARSYSFDLKGSWEMFSEFTLPDIGIERDKDLFSSYLPMEINSV